MPAEGGRTQARQPSRDRPDDCHAVSGQVRGPAQADRDDHRDERSREPAGDPASRQDDHDDSGRQRRVLPVRVRERACHLQQPGQRLLARGRYPEHVRELSGGDLDTDAGQEPDQHRAGQEIRQEAEPGDPGEQQHPSGQQSRQPGQPDVPLRSRHGQTGERGGEDGRGGRVRGHDQVARRAEDGEHRHRQEQGVQAGYQRHPGDLRVAEDLGDAEGGQREAGQRVRGNPGPLHGQHAPHHGQDPQPSMPALADRPRHRLTSARPPGVWNSFIIPPSGVYFSVRRSAVTGWRRRIDALGTARVPSRWRRRGIRRRTGRSPCSSRSRSRTRRRRCATEIPGRRRGQRWPGIVWLCLAMIL